MALWWLGQFVIKDESQHTHANFKGLRNNVAAGEFDLEDLEVALNVEVNDKGVVQRRKGYSAAVVAGSFHSLWSGGGVCLAVSGTTLYRIAPGYATTALRTDLTANLPVSYYAINDRVYYSNGVQTGVVDATRHRTWGLERPAKISATAISGSFRAGLYQFAMTYVRSDGQESGASVAGVLELTSPGGFRFSNLPVSADPDVTSKALYISTWDGTQLYLCGVVSASATSFDVDDPRSATDLLTTQHLLPPPAGEIVSYHNGRMLVASGSHLHPSQAYAYELFDRREVIPFESRITTVAPVTGGAFVGTETQVVYLAGDDITRSSYVVKADYGVIPGTLARAQADGVGEGAAGTAFAVASKQGMCVLGDGGAFKNLTQDRFGYPATPAGAGLVRRHRGMHQYVSVLRGTETAANQHI